MTDRKFKSMMRYSNAVLEVSTGNPNEGAWFRTNGLTGVSISEADAIEIRDMLIERYGLPKPPTFHEEFKKLEIGQSFTVTDGPNDLLPWRSVKLSDTEYFESCFNKRRHIQWASAGWTIKV